MLNAGNTNGEVATLRWIEGPSPSPYKARPWSNATTVTLQGTLTPRKLGDFELLRLAGGNESKRDPKSNVLASGPAPALKCWHQEAILILVSLTLPICKKTNKMRQLSLLCGQAEPRSLNERQSYRLLADIASHIQPPTQTPRKPDRGHCVCFGFYHDHRGIGEGVQALPALLLPKSCSKITPPPQGRGRGKSGPETSNPVPSPPRYTQGRGGAPQPHSQASTATGPNEEGPC